MMNGMLSWTQMWLEGTINPYTSEGT